MSMLWGIRGPATPAGRDPGASAPRSASDDVGVRARAAGSGGARAPQAQGPEPFPQRGSRLPPSPVPPRWRRARAWASATLFMAYLTAAATAQDLTMRSGEHGDFSRLTLPLPQDAQWRLGRTDGGYRLSLDPPVTGIDTSQVFDRIPRTRLGRIEHDEGAVDLSLAIPCDCHATAFAEGGLLVIDIRSGPAPADSPFEVALAANDSAPAAAAPPGNGYDWLDGLHPQTPAVPESDMSPPALPDHAPVSGTARDLLLRQLARATSQGLIEPRAPRPAVVPGVALPTGAATAESAEPDRPDLRLRPHDQLRLSAETAIDRANPNRAAAKAESELPVCMPAARFSALSSESGAPAYTRIAELRRGLLGEFDSPRPQALEALVGLYLTLGFGAEAGAVLGAFPGVLEQADSLAAMARIIDDDSPLPAAPFAGMAHCDGPVALWAVLAHDPADPLEAMNQAAVLRSFSALPLHLRRQLGPRLTERLLSAGAIEAAQAVRAALARAPGGKGPDLEMIAAELDLAQGNRAAALQRLAAVAEGNSAHAPEALATYAENRVAAGERLTNTTAQLLAARAVEHRGTELGDRLARLEVLAQAASGRFADAFAARDRLEGLSAADAAGITADLVAILTAHADDATFLAIAFSEDDWRGGTYEPELRASLAERLLDAGFARAAIDALPPAALAGDADSLLLARARLAMDDAQGALRILAGRTADDAAILRGAALARLGEHDAALAAYRSAGDETGMSRAAWLSGDHDAIRTHGSEVQSAAIARIAAPIPAPQPMPETSGEPAQGQEPSAIGDAPATLPEGTLGRSRRLLEASRETRRLIDELLAAHPSDGGA